MSLYDLESIKIEFFAFASKVDRQMKFFFQKEWTNDVLTGLVTYYLTTLPVILGVLFGIEFVRSGRVPSIAPSADLIEGSIKYDAVPYLYIVREGYSYNPHRASVVAYFPAYPLLCRYTGRAIGLPTGDVSLLVSNLAFLGACVFMVRYVRVRWPEATVQQRRAVLATFSLWPLGLFFRMPYAESLFVFITLATLYGMARSWPLSVLALLTGFVTGTRPVGVALTAAFLWYILTHPQLCPKAKVIRVVLLGPLACWGLLAFMVYQCLAFGTPWAFALTQKHWIFLAPEGRSWTAKLGSLVTLEPIWSVYMPGCHRYWAQAAGGCDPLFNMIFWNPILFMLAGILLLMGRLNRWLNGRELVLGVCLLAIPYFTRSFEMSMASHGRFSSVVVVNYLVLGRLLAWLPPLPAAIICGGLALFLCLFTSLYATEHLVF